MDYITTISLSPEGADAAIKKFDGWEGTKHLATIPDTDQEGRLKVIWQVPTASVGAGLVLTAGGWYDDLVWGDYSIIENVAR